MAQAWNNHVNTRFYGQDGSYNDNREEVEFKSGRKVYYLKNSIPTKTHALNLTLNDSTLIDGKTEFQWFLYWYENTIKSGTLTFYLYDIITHIDLKEYRFTDVPQWEGQSMKMVSISIEEV